MAATKDRGTCVLSIGYTIWLTKPAARCNGTNFKLADLRHADFTGADLTKATFEHAKVHGAILSRARLPDSPVGDVDVSAAGDGSSMQPASEWVAACRSRTLTP